MKTAADTNTTGGSLSFGYTLPGSLQSFASANYNVVNKVSSADTTADQNDAIHAPTDRGVPQHRRSFHAVRRGHDEVHADGSRRTPGTNAFRQLIANASTTNGGR